MEKKPDPLQKVEAERALAVARQQRRNQICQEATNKAGKGYFYRQIVETHDQIEADIRNIQTAQANAAKAEAKAEAAKAAKEKAEAEEYKAEWERRNAAKHNQKGKKKA